MPNQKIAVITGASRGLGLALSDEFVSHGWQVVGTGRSGRPAELAQDVAYQQFDASDAAACQAFWQKLHSDHPDAAVCLVNNAGGYVSGSLRETTPEQYEQQMRSIYFAAVYMTRGLTEVVSAAKIINIVSSSGLIPHKNNSAYGAAKTAETHFFQSLQREFDARQYQITNLHPHNIASHGPAPNAMESTDLAAFVRQLAENTTSYYLRDATIYPLD